MLAATRSLLRRGNRRPRGGAWPQRFPRVPSSHKPMQGGQPSFQRHLLRDANDAAAASGPWQSISGDDTATAAVGRSDDAATAGLPSDAFGAQFSVRLPQANLRDQRVATPERRIAADEAAEEGDRFEVRRAFNELAMYEEHMRGMQRQAAALPEGSTDGSLDPSTQQRATDAAASSSAAGIEGSVVVDAALAPAPLLDGTSAADTLPDDVPTAEYFHESFGYSMVKNASSLPPVNTRFQEFDLWAEQPKYHPGMYFMYLVARRRNFYAVIYDWKGKKMHKVYSSGNRGLKGGDKGIRSEGSPQAAHQVTSQYLNDVVPAIREAEVLAGRQRAGDSKKIELVVRVLGFYNGRQGGIRALTEKSDLFDVKYVEDITPFPLNGPRLPKREFKGKEF